MATTKYKINSESDLVDLVTEHVLIVDEDRDVAFKKIPKVIFSEGLTCVTLEENDVIECGNLDGTLFIQELLEFHEVKSDIKI